MFLKIFFQQIKSDQILRIKVWSFDGIILYSDDDSIIGQDFSENERFQLSISGHTTTEIKEPVDPENISEIGYGQLMEIYVPIYFDSSQPEGVIELYYNMDPINQSIDESNQIILITVFSIILVIIAAIVVFFIVVHRSSKETIEMEKFSAIGKLSSRLAHDIKNPLSVIKVSAELFLHDKDESKKQKHKESIDRSIDRISNYVDRVLDYVKGNPLKLQKEKISEIINDALDSLVVPENVKIVLPKNDAEVMCDKKQLAIVFSNLVLNGIQAIGKSQGTVEIKITENDFVTIQVKDSGIGIPEDNLNQIFEPLFTTKLEGTGLGLASVRSILNLHNGEISVYSPPTVFTITLPKI